MGENFLQKVEKFKIPVALSLVGIVLIIGGLINSHYSSKDNNYPKESIVEGQKIISVDVSGAVQNPGVYQLKEGVRVEEAISAAGGFSDQSNKEYISKYLNMAQKVSDGLKIYVPFEGDAVSAGARQGVVAGTKEQSQVNINTASQSELEALPGIGPVTASKIISDRPYRKIEELLEKKTVGKATFEKIKDSIVIY